MKRPYRIEWREKAKPATPYRSAIPASPWARLADYTTSERAVTGMERAMRMCGGAHYYDWRIIDRRTGEEVTP